MLFYFCWNSSVKEQYHFLHLALIEAMMSPSVVPVSEFLEAYEESMSFDEEAKCHEIDLHFRVIELTTVFNVFLQI